MSNASFLRSNVFWITLYLLTMAIVFWSGHRFRSWALQTYATAEAQQQWDTWRRDARTQNTGIGPVQRREPKSPVPPALTLMQDHFLACQTLSLVLSTALFGTFMLMIRGLARAPSSADDRDDAPIESAP